VSQFHVNQIETQIRELYESDNRIDELDDVANLSRLLALHAVEMTLGSTDDGAQRIIEITDGTKDKGIDAIGIDTAAKRIVFVQSKWRQDGSGSMALGDVLKFLDGVRSILGMATGSEPVHASDSTRLAVRKTLSTPGARVRLVTATTAIMPLSEDVEGPIKGLLGQLNDLEETEPLATHTHMGQAKFFNSIGEESKPAVDIDLQMLDWGKASDPLKVFYGRVSADQIAGWYSVHGDDLFTENIRVVIPKSEINEGIRDTIIKESEKFFYYNNGITIIANKIDVGLGGTLNRDTGFFRLSGASVVNGAQTVSTLGSVLGADYEANLGSAFVLVRCIQVPQDDEELGRRITRFANTQNEVSSQDFAFLDPVQHRLARELQVLGYEYILRSAELPKKQDAAQVIDVRQAAVALACAHQNLNYSIIAKREVSRLFSETPVYQALFNSSTDALRLLRAVLILRSVDKVLDLISPNADGVEAGIAVHGGRVIAHIVFRQLGDSFLSKPQSDIENALNVVGDSVSKHVVALVKAFPDNAYPGNLFKNQKRCATLLKEAHLP
jgi:AIPR protein